MKASQGANKESIKKEIISICSHLNQKGYLASADGNVSYRFAKEVLITPSGVNKARLRSSQFALVSLEDKILKGNPSSERKMHLAVYKHCPKARAVVHAHPPTAIAWSIARPDLKELPAEAMSELILAVGQIPIVPYARPGTQEMGDVLIPFLNRSRVMILGRHGALSWGETLQEAYNGMERLEHTAVILKMASDLGGITPMPPQEVAILREMRKKLGDRTL